MSMRPDISSGRGKLPLTRPDIEERLRQAGSSEKLELAGENISGSDLSFLNLHGADLSGATLREATLIWANLSGANLSNADLFRADLHRAYLNGATLSGANLSGTNLTTADLSGATLREATLSGANLSGTNLATADLSGATLREATLSGANLFRANLSGANLSGANLLDASLNRANLTGVHFFNTQLTFGPELLLQSLGVDITPQESKVQGKEGVRSEAAPALRLRILEEPLTVRHLSATLDTLTSLYVKVWLLQQRRFDDLVRYTEQKDHRFEEEANLLIAELKYNSPADIKFNFDLSPKALIEALQMLVDTITQTKLRKQAREEENRSKELDNLLKEEIVRKERLNNADHMLETTRRVAEAINTLCPELDAGKKVIAIQSLMKDILPLAEDQTLEISLLLSPTLPQQQDRQNTLQEQEKLTHISEKTV